MFLPLHMLRRICFIHLNCFRVNPLYFGSVLIFLWKSPTFPVKKKKKPKRQQNKRVRTPLKKHTCRSGCQSCLLTTTTNEILDTASNLPQAGALFVFKHLCSALVFVFPTWWPDTSSVVQQHVRLPWLFPVACSAACSPHSSPGTC